MARPQHLLVSASLALILVACAAHRPGPGARWSGGGRPSGALEERIVSPDALLLAGFDTNGDLVVDSAEIEAGVATEFARANKDSDAVITPLEFSAWNAIALGAGNAPRRLDFDRNVDNTITLEEFGAELRARAADYDLNHNARLERSEFIREAPRVEPMMRPPPGVLRQRGEGPPGGGRPPPR